MITAHPQGDQVVRFGRYYPDLKEEEREYLSLRHRKKSQQKNWSDWLDNEDGILVV
jgi:hypothetical protein